MRYTCICVTVLAICLSGCISTTTEIIEERLKGNGAEYHGYGVDAKIVNNNIIINGRTVGAVRQLPVIIRFVKGQPETAKMVNQ